MNDLIIDIGPVLQAVEVTLKAALAITVGVVFAAAVALFVITIFDYFKGEAE